jgi:hypothetical protein
VSARRERCRSLNTRDTLVRHGEDPGRLAYRFGGGSYQSASDPSLHFGLGDAHRVDTVEVRRPSGRMERFGPLEADAAYRLVEGAGAPRPLEGWPQRR